MIDMENDTVEIKMPPMMKKQIRKELQQIIGDAVAAIYEICCHYRYHPIILFWTLYMDE